MSAPRGTRVAQPKCEHGIVVCFAVRDEAKHFHPADSVACQVIVTGMGPQNARRALTAALDSLAPRCVLTCGYAGGLNPDLQRGDLIYDAAPDGNLARQLSQLGARPGTFHCADHIAVTAAQKQALREQTRADAVEMESEVIRALCRQRSVAAATIRVISDDARSDLPLDFNQLSKADGNISYGKLALAMARSPQVIPRLMRFQRELDACSRKLAGLLQDLLLALR